jgi:hypothetical protein
LNRPGERVIPTCIYKISPFNKQTTSNFYNPKMVVPVHQLFFHPAFGKHLSEKRTAYFPCTAGTPNFTLRVLLPGKAGDMNLFQNSPSGETKSCLTWAARKGKGIMKGEEKSDKASNVAPSQLLSRGFMLLDLFSLFCTCSFVAIFCFCHSYAILSGIPFH